MKVKVRKINCPICQHKIKRKSGLYRKPGTYLLRHVIKMNCESCGYRYRSTEGGSTEHVGPVIIHSEWSEADDPGFPDILKKLRDLRDIRDKAIAEVRKLWKQPEPRLILECMLHPNADVPALREKMQQWLTRHKKEFPLCEYYSGEPVPQTEETE